MRWSEKKKKITRDGDTKTVTRFLIFPKKLNGQWRWLEKARWIKKYVWNGDCYEWNDQDWLENWMFDKLIE